MSAEHESEHPLEGAEIGSLVLSGLKPYTIEGHGHCTPPPDKEPEQ